MHGKSKFGSRLLSNVTKLLLSPCTKMPGRSFQGTLPALEEEERKSAQYCQRHVRLLSQEIGPRSRNDHLALDRSVEYISDTFKGIGLEPSIQHFPLPGSQSGRNIEVTIPSSGRTTRRRSLVIGAHYDTVPGSPGADDNASAVAGLLELARLLVDFEPAETIRLVAFDNEEHHGLPSDTLGSHHYAARCRSRGDSIRMISLEMIGYFDWRDGSQHYPPPFDSIYPTTGNFIGFVGNWNSRGFVRKTIENFRKTTDFPSEGLAAPGMFKDLGRSDHSSFWIFGYPALMVTDTANFRNLHYHSQNDTYEKLDYDSMGRIVQGLARTVELLAG